MGSIATIASNDKGVRKLTSSNQVADQMETLSVAEKNRMQSHLHNKKRKTAVIMEMPI